MSDETVTLFRPVGPKELELIRQSGFHAFPPRLAEQPIFYPVLNRTYADQIARDWNSKDPRTGHRGFVTQFRLDRAFATRYELKQVGGSTHVEYWVPAAELAEFNSHIVELIEVVAEFRDGTLANDTTV